MESSPASNPETQALLARLRTFCFLSGEDSVRRIDSIKTMQRGELRTAPSARWMPFTAEEIYETRRSCFRWNARLGGGRLGWLGVTDAYEELQRYLGSVVTYAPTIVNHASLE